MLRLPALVLNTMVAGAAIHGSSVFACQDLDQDGFYGDATCGTLQDCNDASATTYPGAPEVCDGYDNDCNGALDDAPECDTSCDLPERSHDTVRLTDGTEFAGGLFPTWTGNEYGLTWNVLRANTWDLHFRRIDAAGNTIGSNVSVMSSGAPVAWNGSEYAVVRSGDGIHFARIDATGNPVGTEVQVTATESGRPSLVWTGKEYGLAWRVTEATSTQVYFARIDREGNKIGPDLRLTSDPAQAEAPSLTWTGSEFGVAWHDGRHGGLNREIYFARIDASGDKIGSDVRVTDAPADSSWPSLVWTGGAYGVAWNDGRDGTSEIYLARIDATGNKIGSDARVTHAAGWSRFPSLAWTGTEFGVAWQDSRDSEATEIYFARIDAQGVKLGSDLRITNDPLFSSYPILVWTGSAYGVTWELDSPILTPRILEFARVQCNCFDADLDEFSICKDCDDGDANVYPGAPEVCDGVNNDCDDPDWPMPAEYADVDSDGVTVCGGDCDDKRSAVFPGAAQICDGVNNDCDDPDWPAVPADETDDDGDSFAECEGDCDDTIASIGPFAAEVCNRIDDDCNGLVDDGEDTDRDRVQRPCDNCPFDRNPSQGDLDADGEGDRCDLDDGLIYQWFDQPAYAEWQAEAGFASWNVYRGDLGRLHLDGAVAYTQDPARVPLAARHCDLTTPSVFDDDPPPGAAVFFLVTGNFASTGLESSLGVDSFGVERFNRFPCP